MASINKLQNDDVKVSLMDEIHSEFDFSAIRRKKISELLGITFTQASHLAQRRVDEFNSAELKTFLNSFKSNTNDQQ